MPKAKGSSSPTPGPLKRSNMTNVMVDLETLGRRAGCAILSIGAVAFDPEEELLGPEFYRVVQRQNQLEYGDLHEDPSTVHWWMQQSVEAKQVLVDCEGPSSMPLRETLELFNIYLSGFPSVKVWGNGADFDNAILISLYAATGVKQGWPWANGRCYRTLKSLKPWIKLERHGTFHNALDDAKTQALHAIELMKNDIPLSSRR